MPDNSEYTLADMIEDEDDPRIIDSLRVEKSIVDEVRRTTGLSYRFIGGMPTDQADVAEAVLPILAVHLASGVEPAIRWGIYSRFCTKHARPYLGLLVSQLPREQGSTDRLDTLMHAVVMAASDEDVAAAWSAIRNRKDSAAWWTVASKLANRKTAPPEIVAELRRDLYEGNLGFNEIKDISTVRDRRIREWFRSQQNSEDENIARLARRVAGKPIRSPAGVVISSTIPNRDGEVGSLEIDLEEAPQILREFRSTLGLKMPRWLLSPKGLEFLELDQWTTIDLPSKSGAVYTLWLRLEDYDTIEIALTDDSAGDSARSVN